jgi:hypothetical protein
MALLDDIIAGAVSDMTPVATLLRQCLVLAHQLRNDKLKAWAEQELNGYTEVDALPKYRVVKVTATGSFAGPFGNALNNQPLSASILEKELRHWAETAFLTAPIVSFDIGRDDEGKPNGGRIQWPQDLVSMYQSDFIQGWNLVRASQQIPGTVFAAILDTVRTRILQLALELKGEMSDDDIGKLQPSKVDQSVVNHIYGGNVVVAATAENFSQVQNISVVQNDLNGLLSALHELGLPEEDTKRLAAAIKADEKTGSKTVGQKTSEWLKELPITLGKGTLKVGFEVAKALATKYVLSYFGIAS